MLGDGLLASVLGGGIAVATVTLAAGVLAHQDAWPWQSVMFVTLGLAQLGVALAGRAWTARRWKKIEGSRP